MNGECGRVSVPGCSSRYRWGTGPCRIGAWQRGGTVSDRQADVFADGRGWRACLSRATRFRWRIGIEIACMETMKEILERAAASPAGKELAAAVASGEVAVLKGVSGSAYALYAAAVVERRGWRAHLRLRGQGCGSLPDERLLLPAGRRGGDVLSDRLQAFRTVRGRRMRRVSSSARRR